jgi:hypothetical protein
VSDKQQTIYKNTCAAMGQTVLDQDIIPIGNLPRLENVCEEAIADQFQDCKIGPTQYGPY